jgi:excinuclease ABC subunit A
MEMFLRRLKENGNTVVLVEHNPHLVRCADHVIELGPGAGQKGGRVIFSGGCETFFASRRTPSQRFFHRRPPMPAPRGRKTAHGFLDFSGACAHNLKHFDLRIPRRALTVIAGVSGAGKSSLLYDEMFLKHPHLPGIDEKVHIDPGIGSLRPHTNIAGFLGASIPLREFFAALRPSRLLGYQPGHFSFHSPLGRCPECKGRGYHEIEMQFLPSVRAVCRHCRGNGFAPDVLKVVHNGRSIADVLAMSVEEFCGELGPEIPSAREALQGLRDNGMGYLRLGDKLSGLSTGELQKLKLLKHLNGEKGGMLFLLDEPSFALHPYDVTVLQGLIARLLARGNTVVAVEHNLAIIAGADFVVELGPEGGAAGGHLLFSGSPARMRGRADSPTGRHLKKYLQNT